MQTMRIISGAAMLTALGLVLVVLFARASARRQQRGSAGHRGQLVPTVKAMKEKCPWIDEFGPDLVLSLERLYNAGE